MKQITKYERETIVCYNDEEAEADVFTCNTALINKLNKMVAKNLPITMVRKNEVGCTYRLPKKCISFRTPRIPSDKMKASYEKNGVRLAEANKKKTEE